MVRINIMEFEKFLEQFRIVHYDKGEIILRQGEIPQYAYAVKEGVVKTYNIDSTGDERPISFDIKKEIFPVSWIFSKAPITLYYYEAFTDCELYVVPRDQYLEFVRKNPDVLVKILDSFISSHIAYMLQVNALEQQKAASKLLYTLYFLMVRFGNHISPEEVKIQLPLTQQELANFMGITRETTAIELKKLEKLGIVSYQRASYSVNPKKLSEVLDEEHPELNLRA